MKIAAARSVAVRAPLSRPYAIAYASTEAADLVMLELHDDAGRIGLGSAAPVPEITGETPQACVAALSADAVTAALSGDVADFRDLCAKLPQRFPKTPAAAAAIDMALHDLEARRRGVPLVDLLGRCHDALPTSITIGIKPVDETLAEAAEAVLRGFRAIKLKIGGAFDAERERVLALRAAVPGGVRLRIDANAALSPEHASALLGLSRACDLEVVEQPFPPESDAALAGLPSGLRALVALDESVHDVAAARRLAAANAAGTFNVKLMKCGGITPARAIARVAADAGVGLMWGCMDESVVSIAAALHAAYACPATRFLDLDGSFDLAHDPASGGFALEDGFLRTLPLPGLGCRLA